MCDISMNTNIKQLTLSTCQFQEVSRPRTSSWTNWSREMWQSVVNRAVRMLAIGPVCLALLIGICTVD
ncbi:hypothetical protein KIN20_002841 [Parelaphostrongylus tenuis]|uniref:Uncharacterized protein n=1 Tax=Parelaphostrongylus tenuis TaxID=148309 RepID=A0AAD5QFM6_PARTN|nr:hypothetical protein KIN20_002841 [Parelaphostrongylus tenuis]